MFNGVVATRGSDVSSHLSHNSIYRTTQTRSGNSSSYAWQLFEVVIIRANVHTCLVTGGVFSSLENNQPQTLQPQYSLTVLSSQPGCNVTVSLQ